jgi:hypothetical protein
MKKTNRGYEIPEKYDTLEDSLPMLQNSLQKINNEQNWQDKEIKRRKRREFIENVYGRQIWLKK